MKRIFMITMLLILSLWSCISLASKVIRVGEEESISATHVKVSKAGTLATILTDAQQDTCRHLIVSGKLNSVDIMVLRKMAGADGRGNLRLLNLLEAEFVSSEIPYLTIRGAEERILLNLTGEYIKPATTYWGANIVNDISIYASTENEKFTLPDPYKEVRHAYFVLLGYTDRKFNAQTLSQRIPLWKMVTKKWMKVKGHNVSRDKDGHFTYSAFTRKGLFCQDMFYSCPNLQFVILPRKGRIYDRVVIVGDPIRYKKVKRGTE